MPAMTDTPAVLGGSPLLQKSEHRPWPLVTEEERRAVMRVLDRGVLSGSYAPEALALQEELASFVGAKHCLLTHCGTSALQLALCAAGVGQGDEVVVPAYSFVATPLAVALQGAVPVFADVDAVTGELDVALAEAAITPRTKAIMPVHIHGAACDMDAWLALGERRHVAIVEDAAQAHGARCGDRPVGALGVAGGFSMQSSKNLPGGEGGFFVTNDDAAAELGNRLRNFGQDLHLADAAGFDLARALDGTRALDSQFLGSMYRGNEMMAAFARAQLRRLPELTARAQQTGARLAAKLAELPGVTPPVARPGRTSVHHKFRVHMDPAAAGLSCSPKTLRDAMKAALAAEGCEVVFWQSAPLPAQAVFQQRAGFPFGGLEGGTDLAHNYETARYPATSKLLDGSLVLFSQSHPFIAQDPDVALRYADAFARVWRHREDVVAAHARG